MIKPGEIQNKARETGVRDQQIEKDYVISWILQGLTKQKQLSEEIVFKGANKRIKVDISRTEKLEFEPVVRDVFCNYSDLEEHQLLCYSLEEVLVEKLRSIMQRMQVRDFYDIWYLLEVHGMEIDFLLNEFKAKCENKNVNPSEFEAKLKQRLPQYKGRWQKSMKDQIKDLPGFEQVERELMRYLRKLEI